MCQGDFVPLSRMQKRPKRGIEVNPWPKRERRCRLYAFGFIRFSGCASQEPILPAKLFHTSDRRKRHYLIGREIAKAVTA